MVCVRISARRNINSLTRKIPYWRMPTGIKIIGVPREPLSMAYWRKEKDQALAKSEPTVGKRGGLQDQREPVNEP
jgi:hypothetical protein